MFPFRDNIPSHSVPLVTYVLILINALVLAVMWQMPEEKQDDVIYEYAFIPARVAQLTIQRPLEIEANREVEVRPGEVEVVKKKIELPADRAAIIFSIFSSMFMHGGLMHLLGNMWFLYLFGDNVEDRLGKFRYVMFYLIGGFAAVACHWLNDPRSTTPVLGASGAVSAVLGGYVVTWPHARIKTLVTIVIITVIELPALLFLGGWFAMQIYSALTPDDGMGGGVAWWAHIGGFICGAVLMPALRHPEAAPEPDPFDFSSHRRFGDF